MNKPETALRRAQDLLSIGKELSALTVLHTCMGARRYQVYSEQHEALMLLYVELAVSLRKSAKPALSSFKSLCGQEHVESFSTVVKAYIKYAAEATERENAAAAKATAQEGAQDTTGDSRKLETEEGVGYSPEDDVQMIALSAGADAGKSRRLRRNYEWDVLRSTLDVLKNNGALDDVYHHTTAAAIRFCVAYQRVGDFRKLCDSLRTHLNNSVKYHGQSHGVNLEDETVIQEYLQTRFQLLRASLQLDVWHEALYIVQDIHTLLTFGDEAKPMPLDDKLSVELYSCLRTLFWDNTVIHSYCCLNLFSTLKAAQEDNVTTAADESVLSYLMTRDQQGPSAVLWDSNEVFASLLDFSSPSKDHLAQLIDGLDILHHASSPVRAIYRELEARSKDAATLFKALQPHFEALRADKALCKYVPYLEDIVVEDVCQILSRNFASVRVVDVTPLCPPISQSRFEAISIRCGARIDQRTTTLFFEELTESRVASLLSNAMQTAARLQPPAPVEDSAMVAAFVQRGRQSDREKHASKRALLAERRRLADVSKLEQEKKDREMQDKIKAEKDAAEAQRLRENEAFRQEEARRKLLREQEQKRKKVLIAEIRQQEAELMSTRAKDKIQKLEDKQLEELTADELTKLRDAAMTEEENVQARKQRDLMKRRDYFVRACRLEEAPLLAKQAERDEAQRRSYFEKQKKAYQEKHRADFEFKVAEKKRLQRMRDARDSFGARVLAQRREAAAARLEELKPALEKIRIAEEEEAARRAKEEAIREAEAAKELEEQRKLEEALHAKKLAEQEQQAKLDQQARIQHEKMEAAEERRKQRLQKTLGTQAPARADTVSSWKAGAAAASTLPPSSGKAWKPKLGLAAASPLPNAGAEPARPVRPTETASNWRTSMQPVQPQAAAAKPFVPKAMQGRSSGRTLGADGPPRRSKSPAYEDAQKTWRTRESETKEVWQDAGRKSKK